MKHDLFFISTIHVCGSPIWVILHLYMRRLATAMKMFARQMLEESMIIPCGLAQDLKTHFTSNENTCSK